MNQIATVSSKSLPTPINADLDVIVRRLNNALVGNSTLPADAALPPAVRQALEGRRSDLDVWLAPVGPDDARKAVAAVLAVMPTQGGKGSAEDAVRIQNLYIRALADVPRYAMQHACFAALKGELGSATWAPTPGELREAAERHSAALVRERRQVVAVLEAKVGDAPVDEYRKREMIARARQMVGGWSDAARGQPRGGMTAEEIEDARKTAAALDRPGNLFGAPISTDLGKIGRHA